jgi:IK cytokine
LAALAYQAVGPSGLSDQTEDSAERRKQLIEESKFLGGDMKHTHLVKGLDYALLQKMKAEIEMKEEEELEKEVEEAERKALEAARKADLKVTNERELESSIRTSFARNVVSVALKLNRPLTNELFSAGRMAYQFGKLRTAFDLFMCHSSFGS